MKVCFFSHSAERGGAEMVLLETVDVLQDNGVECHVIVPRRGPLLLDLEDIGVKTAIIEFPLWMSSNRTSAATALKVVLKNLARVLQAKRQIFRWGCDIIYTNTVTVVLGAMVAGVSRIPHIWDLHEFGCEDHGLVFDLGERLSYLILQRLSDVCIVHSHAVALKYSRHISPSKIELLNMSMHRSFTSRQGDDSKTLPRVPPRRERNRCVIVGTLVPSKGQEDAINAVGELARKGVRVELLVVGDGDPEYKQRLATLTRSIGLDSLIHFIGYVEDPLPFFKSADVALMCSRSEAFGRVTIEAMRAGKPVIGARSGATPELVREGFNGLLYQPGNSKELADKIQFLCDNPGAGKVLGETGMQWAASAFTRAQTAKQLLCLMSSLIGA